MRQQGNFATEQPVTQDPSLRTRHSGPVTQGALRLQARGASSNGAYTGESDLGTSPGGCGCGWSCEPRKAGEREAGPGAPLCRRKVARPSA